MTTIDTSIVNYLSPLLVVVIVFIIAYLSLKKLKVPGSDSTHSILSVVIALLIVTSKRVLEYSINIIPWFAVITVILFLTLLLLAFVGADDFKKPLAVMGFIAAILVVLTLLFEGFPTFYHMLPNTSNAYLSSAAVDFKDFVYSNDFFNNLFFVAAMIGVAAFVVKK